MVSVEVIAWTFCFFLFLNAGTCCMAWSEVFFSQIGFLVGG